jgi:hypothetical protein
VTARAEAMDSLISTANAVATFKDASDFTYLFVQGGASDDMVIKVGEDADLASANSLTVTTNVITFTRE